MNNNVIQHYKKNPKQGVNPLSKYTLWWLLKLFYKGTRRSLEIKDLYETLNHNKSEHLGNKLEHYWNLELSKKKNNPKYIPNLKTALIKTFMLSFNIQLIFMLIFECVLRVASPFLLGRIINEFNQTNKPDKNIYIYGGLLLINSLLLAFFRSHTMKARLLLGMRVRIALASLIYRKILRLQMSALAETSVGQITNLLSNDLNRFDQVFVFLPYIPVLPFQTIIVGYFLWENVHWAALAGVFLMAIQTVPLQGYIGKLGARFRLKIAQLTDTRVILMNEIVAGIQVIKMYAWEKPFEKFVELARLNEVKIIRLTSCLRGFNTATMVFTERTTLFLTALAYSLMGYPLTPDRAFSIAQYFNVLQCTMAIFYPIAVLFSAEALVSVERVRKFLLLDEKHSSNIQILSVDKLIRNDSRYKIIFKNCTASWIKNKPVIKDVSMKVANGELCAIIGSVGCGKSSILHSILSELLIESGDIEVNGTISYCSQEPWLFVSSVRNNILFGQPYNQSKYRRVVHACNLTTDFEQFPYGDKTIISDKGSSLSGGQKARINLARAIYRDADIYILDDPLSAVDAHVGKHLFNECIDGYLKGKTIILVTHQIQLLESVKHIVVIDNGAIYSEGTYDEVMANQLIVSNKFDDIEEVEIEINRKISKMSVKNVDKRASVITDEPKILEEEMQVGSLDTKLYIEYFKASGSKCQLILFVFILIITQLICSSNDYWLSYWTNEEEARSHQTIIVEHEFVDYNGSTIENPNYINYNITNDVSSDQISKFLSKNDCIYVYTGFIFAVILSTLTRSIYFYTLCTNVSINLHNQMFHTLLKAKMSFFDKNPIGRILNRFSKDVGIVDEILPMCLVEFFQVFSVMIGILCLIISINYYMIIPTIILLFSFIKLRSIFLSTAQDVRRLEGITKSPMFSHASSSVLGLATIRSCNAQETLRLEFDQHQDLHTSSWYLTVVCGVSLSLWIDVMCALFLGVVTFSFILLQSSNIFTGSQVGLALSQAMILVGMTQIGIKQSVDTTCHMTSVERILEYTKIEKEEPEQTPKELKLSPNWPNQGKIVFDKVYMKYDKNEPSVLKNLNLKINPHEKVGIVGRTGAGKSSLISSLFHLYILEGKVIIDDVDISQVGLNDLRSRISTIPQQPVLFTASIRFNLDPFDQYEDHILWKTLELIELKDAIPSLDFQVQSGGNNFSIGQRQLICLARAILKRNKVLILDEATANVDPQTDNLIQKTIREHFVTCTVLTIAHRLNTIMDSDKVLVMNLGQVAEFDHPYILLQNKDGIFYSLVEETGETMRNKLHNIAKEAYFNKSNQQNSTTTYL